MIREYIPILLQAAVAIAFAVGALLLSVLLGKSGLRTRTKDSPYECGMVPQGEAQPRFSVKFYLVGMLFILFDVEAVFLYPWAVVAKSSGWIALVEIVIFFFILFLGFLYAHKKGALKWM